MPTLPYGDIFLADTPALDKLGQQLYAEHKQRELDRRNQIQAMDNEFSKNVANIRDADVGDIAKLYGDWKGSTQQLMKQKGGATPEQQLENLRKKAEMYKALNESKAFKEREEFRAKRYAMKPGDFVDNAGELMAAGRKLPVSQLRQYKMPDGSVIDLTNDEPLLYQDKTDWQKILSKAEGTLTQKGEPVIEPIPGGLEEKVITFKAKSSPLEFYNSLVGSMTNAKSSESLANRYQFTPEEAQTITDEFNKVKETPAFKNAYGKIDFPESSNLTEGLRTAKLLAMQHAIHNQPTSSFVNKPVKKAIMDEQQANRKEIQAIGHKNSLARLYANASVQDRKPEAMGRNIDGLISGHISDARDNGGVVVTDAETYKSITGQNKLSSSVLMVDEAGNYKYGKKNENGEFVVTGEIPLDAAKIKLTKTYKSGLDSRYNTGNVKPPASTIPTYSKSDLIKAGWTEDQIKQAVNAKKIKVN